MESRDIPAPQCFLRKCKHFWKGKPTFKQDEAAECDIVWCSAFPGGIPDEIAWEDNLHTEPYPGDHGIQYEKEEEGKD